MQIQLTQGYSASVDESDYEWLSRYKWHYKNGYAARSEDGVRIWMHDMILGVNQSIDHIDRNGLNNSRSNLRLASHSLQGHNRLMPKRELPRGVVFHNGKYQASHRVDGVLRYLGRFDSPDVAYEAYRESCFAVHGEYPPEWTV